MRLVERRLGPHPDRAPADPDDENSLPRPLFGFLSQRAVAAEVANNPHPFPRMGSVAALRDRWRSQSNFIADMINLAMWTGNFSDELREEVAAGTERMVDGDGSDLIEFVHELAYVDVRQFVDMPSQRFRFAAMIGAEGDPTIEAAIYDSYREYLTSGKDVIPAFL
jgi:hypothetical protein